jgi:hypothetical protein
MSVFHGREWIRVYDFANEHDRIRDMQKVSTAPNDRGLSPTPLIGSRAWWEEIERAKRPVHVLEGTISRVNWTSMNDWPEFALRTNDGIETSWTRRGDLRRFVEGLGARVAYVEHAWKRPQQTPSGSADVAQIELWIDVEDSDLRSSGIAPGPGGSGYGLAARKGGIVHYLVFDTPDSAATVVSDLKADEFEASAWPASGRVLVLVWQKHDALIAHVRSELESHAAARGGSYDGGETPTGDIWGPR